MVTITIYLLGYNIQKFYTRTNMLVITVHASTIYVNSCRQTYHEYIVATLMSLT